MRLTRLAFRDLARNAFQSWIVFLCAMLVTGLALGTALVVNGAQDSLGLAVRRLGADIVVVPRGARTNVESALLMGTPAKVWMPQEKLDKIRHAKGVAQASPQLYLASLSNASCCSAPNMFMVAYDPKTDFTLQPWLEKNLGGGLKLGESVGGAFVFVPEGEQNIKLYNYLLTLKANLAPTGTNLDKSLFLTFDTAGDMARLSRVRAKKPLVIPPGKMSAVLVKVDEGAKANKVAATIIKEVPGVSPIVSPQMFGAFRSQMTALIRSMVMVLTLTLTLSLALIALVFSMMSHQRRREIGVLRALGATRGAVVKSLIAQAAILSICGGLVGIALSSVGIYLFRDYIVKSVGFPFLFPSLPTLVLLVAGGMAVALAAVITAAFVPAVHTSLLDPAVAMRE